MIRKRKRKLHKLPVQEGIRQLERRGGEYIHLGLTLNNRLLKNHILPGLLLSLKEHKTRWRIGQTVR